MKIRYLIPLITLVGCTPKEIDAWLEWNEKDPIAAQEFANNLPEPVAINQPLNNHASTWDRIAYCESGGNWSYPPVTNRTGTYSGGLMIWQKAWIAYGGQQYAGWAYQASKAQQIDIAENILADQGWGAWDCY